MNSSLSQEEIAALFGQPDGPGRNAPLTREEVDALGEMGNISMGGAATALGELLGRRVRITTPRVKVINLTDLAGQYQMPFVVVQVSYTKGIEGNNMLILREVDARAISGIMMGMDNPDPDEPIGELQLSAISEAMNQMMGASSTSMSDMFGRQIEISPPAAMIARIADEPVLSVFNDSDDIVQISFSLQIEGLAESEVMQLMPVWFGRQLVNALLNPGGEDAQPEEAPAAAGSAAPPPRQAPPRSAEQPAAGRSAQQEAPRRQQPVVDARPVRYPTFEEEPQGAESHDETISRIIDVPMQVTIELGKCRKTIREILEFDTGTILVLEKLAGEPVEIVVNDKLLARGEVVQIEDNYGVRITEIMSKTKQG